MARLLRQKIAYLEQRGEELESLLFAVFKHAREKGVRLEVPLIAEPIDGDKFITDVRSGELALRLLTV